MRKQLSLFFALSIILASSCADQPLNPVATVAIDFEFVADSDGQWNIGGRPDLPDAEYDNDFSPGKSPVELQTIDQVRVMVLDLTMYDSSAAYFASEDFQEFADTRDNWPGDLSQWAEWEKLLGDYFRIVVDQSLRIEGDQARGTVSGVAGLNYVIVAMIEDACIRYWGEGEVRTVPGEVSHLHLPVSPSTWSCPQ